jgi:hypothetical protein
MNLTLYYLGHTFLNGLKKIFRTWVAFFLIFIVIMGLLGGIVGFSIGHVIEQRERTEAYEEATSQEYEKHEEEAVEESETKRGGSFQTEQAKKALLALPLVIILVTFLYAIYTADKSGTQIFNMADVNFLFTAPLHPTAVLLFRMNMQMGAKIVASIYLLFQIPNLVNAGVSVPKALLLFLAWAVNLIMCQQVGVLTYTLLTGGKKKRLELAKRGVIAVLLLVAAAYFFFYRANGNNHLAAVGQFFGNASWQWVPLIGWLAAFCIQVITGNLGLAFTFLLMTIGGTVLLYVLTSRLPADFYEDALPGAERNQVVLERKNTGKSEIELKVKRGFLSRIFARTRKNFSHGRGAAMFLMRSLHDRRYGYLLGMFTKTCNTYLLVAAGLIVLNYFAIKSGRTTLIIYLIGMGFIVFLRAFGNPLAEEMGHDFIYLVPERPAKKLLFSLASGLVESVLNILPSYLLICLVLRPDLPLALSGFVLLMVMDLFMTITTAMISLLLPTQLPDMIRSWIQMIAISMTLLVVVVFAAVGVFFGGLWGSFILLLVSMLLLSALFFLPCPYILARGRR